MKFILSAAAAVVLSFTINAGANVGKTKWLESSDCKSMTVSTFTMGKKAEKSAPKTVTDPAKIKGVTELLAKIPTEGTEMMSWGEGTKVTEVTFDCAGGKTSKVQFYEKFLQTPPKGAFNKSQSDAEKNLFSVIQVILVGKG